MNELKWIYKHEPYFDFQSLIGIDYIIKFIRSKITNPINSPLNSIGEYDSTIGNIFSVGPRGTLKHELSQAIAKEIHAMYYDIELDEIEVEEKEEDIRKLFQDISRYEHAIIYCELPEFGNALERIIKAQREYINVHGKDSVIIMACSDEPLDVNSNYFEKDYFKYLVNHTLPDYETRKKLLLFGEFDESDYEKDFPFDKLAEMTNKYSYADFDKILSYIHRSDEFMKRAINQHDVKFKSKQFIKYIKRNKPKVTENILIRFQEWKEEIIEKREFKGEII